ASTGDGIVAALQVLALMIRKERPLSELAAAAMTRVPQVLKNVNFPMRRPIEEMKKLQMAMRSVSKSLGRKGRILVRWSGTEAKLRVMIEGENEASIARQAESLIAAARQDFGERG
ncbi:MAG: phosphoglucosamine mutase, partial [Vicinamibacteria bacterium]|nr:phosphoglucosamine mutase [Vicinamibacteria bacterium]